jgi:hypothetical protein
VIGEECLHGRHSLDPHPLERDQFTLHAPANDPHARRAAAAVLQDAPPAHRAQLVGRDFEEKSRGVSIAQ